MAGKRVLTRLLRLRELEEEQARQTLELSVITRNRLREDIEAERNQEVQGRAKFVAGLAERDTSGRYGGLLEMEVAERRRMQVLPYAEAAETDVVSRREAFLERRTGRQQVETLIQNQVALDAVETTRKAQQMMDDWYGRKTRSRGAVRDLPPLED